MDGGTVTSAAAKSISSIMTEVVFIFHPRLKAAQARMTIQVLAAIKNSRALATMPAVYTNRRKLTDTVTLSMSLSFIPEALAPGNSTNEQSSSIAATQVNALSSALTTAAQNGNLTTSLQQVALAQGDTALSTAVVPADGLSSTSFVLTVSLLRTVFPTGQPTSQPTSVPSLQRVRAPPYNGYMLLIAGVCLGFGVGGVALVLYCVYYLRPKRGVSPEGEIGRTGRKSRGMVRISVQPSEDADEDDDKISPREAEPIVTIPTRQGQASPLSSMLGLLSPSARGRQVAPLTESPAWARDHSGNHAAPFDAAGHWDDFSFLGLKRTHPRPNDRAEEAGRERHDTRPVTPEEDWDSSSSLSDNSSDIEKAIKKVAVKLLGNVPKPVVGEARGRRRDRDREREEDRRRRRRTTGRRNGGESDEDSVDDN